MGTLRFSIYDISAALVNNGNDTIASHVLHNIRLPRILLAALVGFNLAVAGALLQGILRNPLASPQIIGVNSGAAFGAIIIMTLFPQNMALVPLAAFAGAICTTGAIYGLTVKRNFNAVSTIVLAGIAVSALLSALTSGMMFLYSDVLEITYSWLLGGLSGRTWQYFQLIIPYTLLGGCLAIYMSPRMNLFVLGEEVGASLGLAIERCRFLVLLCASVLAGSAVAAAGTIGFVGLIAPHIARLLVGNDYRYLTVFSGVLGALLLVVADTMARVIFLPLEIPTGVITAVIGAPFFLWLLLDKRN
ncbi:MAG: iron ABC transporter permease [Negativicutes bacterium]|nr:iron ABC transporter permease [Negativicutes bacterium]